MEVDVLKQAAADIRTKVTVIAANADRYPVSAQCEIPGVPRSTYYYLRSHPETPPAPDPIEPDVLAAHAESRGRYGSRKGQGVARATRHIGEPKADRADHEGERPLERVREEAVQGPPGKPNEAGAAEPGGPRVRRPRAAHARLQRPHLRARRRPLVLRLPARRPLQQGDRRPLGGKPARGRSSSRQPSRPWSSRSRTSRSSTPTAAASSTTPRSTSCLRRSASSGRSPPRAAPTTTRPASRRTGYSSGVRLPRGLLGPPRPAIQAVRLHPLVQQLQDPLDARLHEPRRVQEGGAVPRKTVQISVANPR